MSIARFLLDSDEGTNRSSARCSDAVQVLGGYELVWDCVTAEERERSQNHRNAPRTAPRVAQCL